MNYKDLKKIIRESIEEALIGEERISHDEAVEKVKNLENFIGSHTYGEDLGGLEKMYVVYSYGEQFPLYMHYNGEWFENTDKYILDDGRENIWTEKHREDLRPNLQTQGRSDYWMKKTIKKFKNTHGLGKNTHTDLEPGEK